MGCGMAWTALLYVILSAWVGFKQSDDMITLSWLETTKAVGLL